MVSYNLLLYVRNLSHPATLLGQGITTVIMGNPRVLINYGQPQYPQHAPQQNYSHGYGDPRYNAPPPNQQYYGQPPMGPQQGYPQQPDPYARPPYSGPAGQWTPRGAPAADGMAPTRRHQHLMGHRLSNLLLMGKHMVQQRDLMGMVNRVTHSRVARYQLHMVRVHQQLQDILSKVAMHSTRRPNQHMVIKQQLKPMRTMGTRELQQIPTTEVPTHSSQGMVRQLVMYASSAPAASQPAYGQAGYTQPPTNPPSYDQSAAPAVSSLWDDGVPFRVGNRSVVYPNSVGFVLYLFRIMLVQLACEWTSH
ncbi:hypothetical protein ZEAMMB73_Zm00001d011871 [Zea mays]|jgi:far upstream element-binding protein|nr:hypothetical protein ZEAMMB73_Zm00001d011871 [Zea mays]